MPWQDLAHIAVWATIIILAISTAMLYIYAAYYPGSSN